MTDGRTSLIKAMEVNDMPMVDRLLAADKNQNYSDKNGFMYEMVELYQREDRGISARPQTVTATLWLMMWPSPWLIMSSATSAIKNDAAYVICGRHFLVVFGRHFLWLSVFVSALFWPPLTCFRGRYCLWPSLTFLGAVNHSIGSQ